MMMTAKKTSGIAIATAAAALMLSGCGSNPPAEKAMAVSKAEAKVHCSGVNSCKGHAECATAKHSCKGQNACKGQGWVSMTSADCSAKGGKVVG